MLPIKRTVTQTVNPEQLRASIAYWNRKGYRMAGWLVSQDCSLCVTYEKVGDVWDDFAKTSSDED